MSNNDFFIQRGNKEHEPGTSTKGFKLFGVRVMEGGGATGGSFRKSASMTNLALLDTEQQHQHQSNNGYASDDVVHPSARSRERRRGVPWTEEEHKLFLLGLQKVGKGDWRGISRNFVKTRTPTQVASHAQKYFLRRSNSSCRRRRSSLFDITTDTAQGAAKLEDNKQMINCPMSAFNSFKAIRPIPGLPVPVPASKMSDFNLNLSSSASVAAGDQKSGSSLPMHSRQCPVASMAVVVGIV